MKRRHDNNSRSAKTAFPTSMIDVVLMVLAVTLIQAQFLVKSVPLPNIVRTEPPAATAGDKIASQIVLRVSGQVTYQGDPIAMEELPARIKSEPDQAHPVLLSIERDGEGRISDQLPQLLHDLSDSGVGHRVQIQYANSNTGERK